MKYFYCQSYQAFNLALALSMEDKVTIITSAENIIKACSFLKVDFIEHKPFRLKDFMKKKSDINYEIERLVRIIDKNEMHFSHAQFAVFCFYLVKTINDRKGKTIFHNFELLYKKPKSHFSNFLNKQYLYSKINNTYLKLQYKLPVEIRKSTSNAYVISLKMDYIQRKLFKIIDDKASYFDITLKMFKNFEFDYLTINHIFVSQTFKNTDLFDEDKINEVLPVINQKHMTLKNHPKLGPVKGLEKCKTLPTYLPVELFFQKVKGSVISFHSASLITASKFENVNSISILDIVRTDDPFNDTMKSYLSENSNDKIRFISEIDEFKNIIDA